MTRRGALLFAAMSVIWGIPYLLIRIAVRDLDPAIVVLGRTTVGALVLLPFALRIGAFGAVIARWRIVLVYTAVELAAPWWLLTDAERHVSSSLAGLLIAAVPLIGAALGLALGHDERLGLARATGLGLGLLGVVALLGVDVGDIGAWPLVEILLTALGYAIGPVIVTRRLSDLPSITTNTVVLGIAAAGFVVPSLLRLPSAAPAAAAVWSVLALGVVCTALAFVLFFALIAEVGPARATVITYVNPAVALAAGVLVLGEPVTTGMLVGFPLILLGSFLATRRGTQRVSAAALPEAP